MDIQEVIAQVKDKFGDKVDINRVTEMFKGVDLSKFSMNEVMDKVKNLVGDLDGDGVQEGLMDELKGKAGDIFGGLGKKFGL